MDFEEFECETGEVGVFPNEEHPRVLHVELISDKLIALQKSVEDALKDVVPENSNNTETFFPHITVTRVYTLKSKKFFKKHFEETRVKKMVFPVDNFSLIKSELTPKGPIYKVLKNFELKGLS